MVKYLALAPHPDDVELGCIAALQSMIRKDDEILYVVMSKCLDIERNKNILSEFEKVTEKLEEIFPCKFSHKIFDFPNRRLFETHMEIRAVLDKIRDEYKPDVVFTTSLNDLHQDHKYLSEETIRVFRRCTVLSYEISTSVGNFQPSLYKIVTKEQLDNMIDIVNIYESQKGQQYMSDDLIRGILKHRGGEIGVDFAQAFEVIRAVL